MKHHFTIAVFLLFASPLGANGAEPSPLPVTKAGKPDAVKLAKLLAGNRVFELSPMAGTPGVLVFKDGNLTTDAYLSNHRWTTVKTFIVLRRTLAGVEPEWAKEFDPERRSVNYRASDWQRIWHEEVELP